MLNNVVQDVCMVDLGKAKSLSVSFPERVWELIDEARGKQGRSDWLGDLVQLELNELGLLDSVKVFDDLVTLVREASDAGVDVKKVVSDELRKVVA